MQPGVDSNALMSEFGCRRSTNGGEESMAGTRTANDVVAKLAVRDDEPAWTSQEFEEVQQALRSEVERLEEEIATAEAGLAALIQDSGEGAGDDQADAGSKTFEREHEMSLANNARDMLEQVHHALGRLADGTYGICEGCSQPIGKYRLQAFPRASLCLPCKQAEERFL
jgi:DnaK suppressor protein